jgi:hypothetical protein
VPLGDQPAVRPARTHAIDDPQPPARQRRAPGELGDGPVPFAEDVLDLDARAVRDPSLFGAFGLAAVLRED